MAQQPTPIEFNVTALPGFMQSVGNPMLVSMSKTQYAIGQFFYVEIWTVPSKNIRNTTTPRTGAKLLTTLQSSGPGDGTVTIDVSNALNTLFRADNYTVPDLNQLFQKDESAYIGYFLKGGFITYNSQNQEVKSQQFDTGATKWAVRAARPIVTNTNADGDMTDYCYRHDGEPVLYLTTIPAGAKRKRREPTLLSFILPVHDDVDATAPRIVIYADLNFSEGDPLLNVAISSYSLMSGGIFILNVRPEIFAGQSLYTSIVSYRIRVKYEDDITYSTDATADAFFKVGEDIPGPVDVLFMNQSGSWDALHFRREYDTETKTKASLFNSGYSQRIYNVGLTTTTTYQSPYLTQAEYDWLEDLRDSLAIYVNGIYSRQTDGSFKFDTSVGLFTYELSVAPDQVRNTIRF